MPVPPWLLGGSEGFAGKEGGFAVVLAFEDAGFEPALGAFGRQDADGLSDFDEQKAIVSDHHGDADIVAERDQALPLFAGISVHGCQDALDAPFREN